MTLGHSRDTRREWGERKEREGGKEEEEKREGEDK